MTIPTTPARDIRHPSSNASSRHKHIFGKPKTVSSSRRLHHHLAASHTLFVALLGLTKANKACPASAHARLTLYRVLRTLHIDGQHQRTLAAKPLTQHSAFHVAPNLPSFTRWKKRYAHHTSSRQTWWKRTPRWQILPVEVQTMAAPQALGPLAVTSQSRNLQALDYAPRATS